MAEFGNTALMLATHAGNTEEVLRLIKEGADPDVRNKRGGTALMIAVHEGHDDVVKVLLENGANPDQQGTEYRYTALMYAVSEQNENIVKYILDAEPNLGLRDASGFTALHMAILSGNAKIVDMLMEAGADPLILDGAKRSSLDLASAYNGELHSRMMERLDGKTFYAMKDAAMTQELAPDKREHYISEINQALQLMRLGPQTERRKSTS